ncbi:F-box protein CPR1-like [Rosa sericea]
MAGCMAICSRMPPPPSQIYSADRLRNWLRQLFFSGGVLNKQPCLCSESWNDDIIVEILSKLPVKSLLRCRSVCKSWRALISRSYFVKKHLNHAINGIDNSTNCTIRLLFLHNKNFLEHHPESMLVDSLKDFVGHTASKELDIPGILEVIVGSCNGLICLKAGCGGVFLWNPCTGDASKLPEQTVSDANWGDMFFGFGYDSTTEDYKVILGGTTTTKMEVFTLKKGSWRNVGNLKDYGKISGQGWLSNGALHWIEKGRDDQYSSTSRIILFNLAEEKFLEMVRLSFLSNNKCSQIGMSTIRNSLFVYCAHEVISDPILFTIWTMEEYGVMESWTKVQIHRDCVPRPPALLDIHYIGPIVILQNGEVLMTWNSGNLSSFILYNLHKKKSRIASRIRVCDSYHQAMYIETLVSPITGSGEVDI